MVYDVGAISPRREDWGDELLFPSDIKDLVHQLGSCGRAMPGKECAMPLGPVEILEVKFPGNQFTGEIAPALAELVGSGMIRIIDFLFVGRADDGRVVVTEFNDLGEAMIATYDPLVSEVSGLISEEDVARMSEALEPGSSAAIMLFENVWATRFADSLRNANAEVILNERIPRDVIEMALLAALEEAVDEELAEEELEEELEEALEEEYEEELLDELEAALEDDELFDDEDESSGGSVYGN